MVSLPGLIAEFQTDDRLCSKRARWTAPEEWVSCSLSAYECTHTYPHIYLCLHTCTPANIHTCAFTCIYVHTPPQNQASLSQSPWLAMGAHQLLPSWFKMLTIPVLWPQETKRYGIKNLKVLWFRWGICYSTSWRWMRKQACLEEVNGSLEEWAHLLQKSEQMIKPPFVCGSRKPSGHAASSENPRYRLK